MLFDSIRKFCLTDLTMFDRGSCRLNEMERCESDRARHEVYPATFGDEEKTGLKVDMMMMLAFYIKYVFGLHM